jgi:hypothetical protein
MCVPLSKNKNIEDDDQTQIDLYLSDCYTNSETYMGTTSTTRYGVSCQRWDANTPHNLDGKRDLFLNLPDATPSDADNFCRDPDGQGAPWCYTMDPRTRWDLCGVAQCGMEFIHKIYKLRSIA